MRRDITGDDGELLGAVTDENIHNQAARRYDRLVSGLALFVAGMRDIGQVSSRNGSGRAYSRAYEAIRRCADRELGKVRWRRGIPVWHPAFRADRTGKAKEGSDE